MDPSNLSVSGGPVKGLIFGVQQYEDTKVMRRNKIITELTPTPIMTTLYPLGSSDTDW